VEIDRQRLTDSLSESARGDAGAAAELMPQVYDRLKSLARHYMAGERSGHTLQPTALIHEAYLRLVDIDRVDWQGKTHFFAVAATQMRRVLVDHARGIAASKRGGDRLRVTLGDDAALLEQDPVQLIALDEALGRLAEESERQASVVEMRLFAGMEVKEVAAALGVSERTVKSDWRFARAWLLRELGSDEPV
jgi:RNA polymerase sigma-70 factor (ECF subfamily)